MKASSESYASGWGGTGVGLAILLLASLFLFAAPPPKPVLPTITVNCPNGGEVVKGGETQMVSWSFTPGTYSVTEVELEWSKDAGVTWVSIVKNLPPSSSPYLWKTPRFETSDQCLVRATLYYIGPKAAFYVSDDSDAVWSIVAPPEIMWYRELQ